MTARATARACASSRALVTSTVSVFVAPSPSVTIAIASWRVTARSASANPLGAGPSAGGAKA